MRRLIILNNSEGVCTEIKRIVYLDNDFAETCIYLVKQQAKMPKIFLNSLTTSEYYILLLTPMSIDMNKLNEMLFGKRALSFAYHYK